MLYKSTTKGIRWNYKILGAQNIKESAEIHSIRNKQTVKISSLKMLRNVNLCGADFDLIK